MEPTTDHEIPTRIGRFEVTGIARRGGVGAVFRAFDPHLQRAVAIELVAGLGAELLTEARALARIAHPNVLAVHEIGTDAGTTFLVTELVEGHDLREWLAARSRSIAEIRACFLQAATGLAAGHAHDLVHGDFKPENVLVGSDGRVRVADFGLARLRSGEAATPSADVHAFSRTLIDALLGEQPATELDRRLAQRGVDRPLRGALGRGGDAELRELIAALAGGPRRTVVWIAAGLGACALGGVALAFALGTTDEPSCGDASAMLAPRWNEARRAVLRGAASRLKLSPAEIASGIVEPFDRYADDWVRTRDDMCHADVSEDRRAARLSCLDRRLFELSASASAVEHASSREYAFGRSRGLPTLAPCAEATVVRMPTGPAQRAAVESITERLLRAQDQPVARGREAAIVAVLEGLERGAESAGDLELRVRTMRARSSVLEDAGRYADAEKLDLAAYDLAVKSGLDTPAVEAVIDVARLAVARQDLGAADSYGRIALGLLERPDNANSRVRWRLFVALAQLAIGKADAPTARQHVAAARAALLQFEAQSPKEKAAILESLEGDVDQLDNKYESALVHIRRSEQLTRELGAQWNSNLAIVLGKTAVINGRLERFGEARRARQAQVDLLAQLVPPTDDRLLRAREGLANAAISDGDLEGGIKLFEEALERGKDNRRMALTRHNVYHALAGAHWDLGHRELARELEQRAVDEAERQYGPSHVEVATKLFWLAEFDTKLHSYARAEAHLDRAEPMLAVLRATHPRRIQLAELRIDLLRQRNDLAGAERIATQTLQLLDEHKADDRQRETLWVRLGEVLLDRRDYRGARAAFTRALTSRQARSARPLDLATAEFLVGRTEYALGERAAGLARIRHARPELDRPTHAASRRMLLDWARANRVAL